jgi:hypothetical protein
MSPSSNILAGSGRLPTFPPERPAATFGEVDHHSFGIGFDRDPAALTI